jgi:hypothetical protein
MQRLFAIFVPHFASKIAAANSYFELFLGNNTTKVIAADILLPKGWDEQPLILNFW